MDYILAPVSWLFWTLLGIISWILSKLFWILVWLVLPFALAAFVRPCRAILETPRGLALLGDFDEQFKRCLGIRGNAQITISAIINLQFPLRRSRSNPHMWSAYPETHTAATPAAPPPSLAQPLSQPPAIGGGVRVGGSTVVTARKEP